MVSLLTEQISAYFGVSVNEPESIFTITLYLERGSGCSASLQAPIFVRRIGGLIY